MKLDQASPMKLMFVAVGVALTGFLSFALFYVRQIFFVPHVWTTVGKLVLWLLVVVMVLVPLVLPRAKAASARSSFAKNGLLIVIGAALIGYFVSVVFYSAAITLNSIGSEKRSQCFVLNSEHSSAGVQTHAMKRVRLLVEGDSEAIPRLVYYKQAVVDLSSLRRGDKFMLDVDDGLFGYTAVGGVRPGDGCGRSAASDEDLLHHH